MTVYVNVVFYPRFACFYTWLLSKCWSCRLSFKCHLKSGRVVTFATTIEKLSLMKHSLLLCVVHDKNLHLTEMETWWVGGAAMLLQMTWTIFSLAVILFWQVLWRVFSTICLAVAVNHLLVCMYLLEGCAVHDVITRDVCPWRLRRVVVTIFSYFVCMYTWCFLVVDFFFRVATTVICRLMPLFFVRF